MYQVNFILYPDIKSSYYSIISLLFLVMLLIAIQFDQNMYTVQENVGSVNLRVRRNSTSPVAATLHFIPQSSRGTMTLGRSVVDC